MSQVRVLPGVPPIFFLVNGLRHSPFLSSPASGSVLGQSVAMLPWIPPRGKVLATSERLGGDVRLSNPQVRLVSGRPDRADESKGPRCLGRRRRQWRHKGELLPFGTSASGGTCQPKHRPEQLTPDHSVPFIGHSETPFVRAYRAKSPVQRDKPLSPKTRSQDSGHVVFLLQPRIFITCGKH